jgi:hypothetical protein
MLCFALASYGQETSEDFEQLVNWMTGSFSSAEQAKSDTNYYDISLEMKRIWPDKSNGAWLYVEQALASTPLEPYRQRVYFVREMGDGQFSSDIYTIPNEEDFVGATPAAFESMTQFDLKYKEGCAVFLDYDGFQYYGQTNEKTCKSELRGANYATSVVKILSNKMESWDRGFDDQEEQVWGAETGPYIFKKIK